MYVKLRSYFTLSFLQYDWRISCLKFGTDQTMMMNEAIPSEREKVLFSPRGVWNIDDRKLSICELREGVLSEWLKTCIFRAFQSWFNNIFLLNIYSVTPLIFVPYEFTESLYLVRASSVMLAYSLLQTLPKKVTLKKHLNCQLIQVNFMIHNAVSQVCLNDQA